MRVRGPGRLRPRDNLQSYGRSAVIHFEVLARIDASPIHGCELTGKGAASQNGEGIPDRRHEAVDQLDV